MTRSTTQQGIEARRIASSQQRLLLSIHDVGPRFESQVDALHDRLTAHGAENRIALLVVPNHWGEAPILAGTPFATRLRQWSDAGLEIFLHGWFHRDDSTHNQGLARLKARHMTAGEGEFLGLSHKEAGQRIEEGRALLEDIIGRPVAGFIAPAWLYSAGAREALMESGVALAEDHMKVWHPPTGKTLCRGPVITWASRSRPRIVSSLAAAALLRNFAFALPVARLAVHPGDARVPVLLKSIDRAVQRLMRTHRPSRYTDLVDAIGI